MKEEHIHQWKRIGYKGNDYEVHVCQIDGCCEIKYVLKEVKKCG